MSPVHAISQHQQQVTQTDTLSFTDTLLMYPIGRMVSLIPFVPWMTAWERAKPRTHREPGNEPNTPMHINHDERHDFFEMVICLKKCSENISLVGGEAS